MAQLTIQQAFDLALQHHQAGRWREAEQIYRQILAQQPEHTDAMHNLGVIASQVGRNDLAVDLIRRAILLRPDYAEAHNSLGNVLKDKGELEEAIAACRQAIALRPNFPEAYNNLGNALRDKGQLEAAIAACRQAIALRCNYAEAHSNLGNALKDKGELEAAMAAYRQAIGLRPNFPEAYSNLGNVLRDQGALDEAISACRQAIALRPNFAEAHNNLGNALIDKGQLDEGIAACRQAIGLRPNFAEAYNNLGNALSEKGQGNDAIAALGQALRLKPDYAEAHLNLGLVLLLGCDWEQGWREYEWRRKVGDSSSTQRGFSQPLWDGSDLKGGAILLHGEQGLGDMIQSIRYLPLVVGRGGEVFVEVPTELIRLLRPLPGVQRWIAYGEPLPRFDVHCPLMSLPGVFKTTLSSIPASVPYLQAEGQLVETWARRLGNSPQGFRLGLNWAGAPGFKGDRRRSLKLSALAPLAAVPGVSFYSLQKGAAAEQANTPPAGMKITNLAAELHDFADTAAVMSLMDLIITTDTSVPHLAGALGKPVWVMLQFVPDWRWLLERDDSPWYPTMRLFRQTTLGDWPGVIGRVVEALAALRLGRHRAV